MERAFFYSVILSGARSAQSKDLAAGYRLSRSSVRVIGSAGKRQRCAGERVEQRQRLYLAARSFDCALRAPLRMTE